MSSDLGRMILEDFIKNSQSSIDVIVEALSRFKGDNRRQFVFFHVEDDDVVKTVLDAGHFFIRSSFEYSNPQLTVEGLQGIIAARLLEACGNYFEMYGLREITTGDIDEIRQSLRKPSKGKAVSFLLNTDDVEPDRYSINPLRSSIVTTGQSAFPSASVTSQALALDMGFIKKYEGSLISLEEAELIKETMTLHPDNYMDMVDAVKYKQLTVLSEDLGIDLCLPSIRMPISSLENEEKDDLLHYIISECHKDYESVSQIYECMGRSMKKRTTLLTVPHSEKGYGSKRIVNGRMYFNDDKLDGVKVEYKTKNLYPNAIDPEDVSIAKADDSFTVDGSKLNNYDFNETPSSPQFFLYSLASPEDAVIWHGIGAFGASELVKSYTTLRNPCATNSIFRRLHEKFGYSAKLSLQFNLIPEQLWFHPIHRNIDASVGCIENIRDLIKIGMRMEHLPTNKYVRG